MNARYVSKNRLSLVSFLSLVCLLAACDGAPSASGGGPYVWIDVPADGLSVPVNQAVRIEGHASYGEGVARVEIWVNGELHLIEESPPVEGKLARFSQSWMPPGVGDYTVQVVAIGADGATSAPDVVRLHVGNELAQISPTPETPATPEPEATSESPTPTPTVEAVTETPAPTIPPLPTDTAAPTATPVAVIEFWADAGEIDAGKCTKLHWHVENVQAVFLDGEGVVGTGSRQVCPCSNETHTLTVVRLDGSQEERTITVGVVGSCVTPTNEPPPPPPDTTPPPAPQLVSPADGSSLSSVAKVTLDWDPVADPSGIDEYRIEVQRHAGDNNWQPVDGSPWTGVTATELEIDVEYGWAYRWRVRAVDGAGNVGPFSDWFEFVVPLG